MRTSLMEGGGRGRRAVVVVVVVHCVVYFILWNSYLATYIYLCIYVALSLSKREVDTCLSHLAIIRFTEAGELGPNKLLFFSSEGI